MCYFAVTFYVKTKCVKSLLFICSNKNVPEWKPPFLSNDEFVHLMLEAINGFVLALSVTDNGRVLYASEGITWLLGHLPNALVDKYVILTDSI